MLTEQDLKQNDFFKLLDSLKLQSKEYLIMGSGVMFALGIRPLEDLDDIDLLVSKSGWEKVKNLSKNIYDKEWDCKHLYLFDDKIEIYNGWGPYEHDFEALMSRSYRIGKYSFQSINDLLKWKTAMGREKDQKHIQMINEYLQKDED
jgi:hypothetical protein